MAKQIMKQLVSFSENDVASVLRYSESQASVSTTAGSTSPVCCCEHAVESATLEHNDCRNSTNDHALVEQTGKATQKDSVLAPLNTPDSFSDSDSDDDVDAEDAVAELIEQLEAGGPSRDAALEALVDGIVDLAFDPCCYRVVQMALEIGGEEAVSLALELRGRVSEAATSPAAACIVRTILQKLPSELAVFIVEELRCDATQVARNPTGCQILCDLVEQQFQLCCEKALIDCLVLDIVDLSRHEYGQSVVEAILKQQGAPRVLHA